MSTPSPPSSPIPLILSTWSTTTLLPPSIPPPQTLKPSLLFALHTLALLTPNQPDRAWNLISTYFHMRVRERGYTAGVGVLDEADILKAVGSVRRMSVGMELEERVRDKARKWSIRDEMGTPTRAIEEDDGDGLPPLPAGLDMPLSPSSPSPTKTHLPPISALLAPTMPSLDALIEAAHAATQETNKRRRELEAREEDVRLARGRYEEAKGLAERLRGEVRRSERREDEAC